MQVSEHDKMNTSNDDEYKGFMVEGETDSATMAKPGVWADHLQVRPSRANSSLTRVTCERQILTTSAGQKAKRSIQALRVFNPL